MKRILVQLSLYIVCCLPAISQPINPDSAALAGKQLQKLKSDLEAQSRTRQHDVSLISRMLELGMWDRAAEMIRQGNAKDPQYRLLSARLLVLHNQFKEAEGLVNQVLAADARNEQALELKAYLQIQAWKLPEAALTCQQALQKLPSSERIQLMLGRVWLLQKNYAGALTLAKKIQQVNPRSAGAYLLEADVYFWDQQPAQAEAPLKTSLEIDPFNADARFSYGYAIWRRIDATQLNAMAAQWELALAINPLHFQTHWHWGNGHTNLTYADYAESDDETVRRELAKADALFKNNQVDAAIDHTREVEKKYPKSVLPLMHRASLYYSAFDNTGTARLDSAESIFSSILRRKAHYGPAHNGLSAVLKSKRIRYLAVYDSITAALQHPTINDMENLVKVFPDVGYFPGITAKAMAWNQLYTAVVYFPFLSKQGNTFRIPPLHNDLAITMNSPTFRYTTTFDNRQWMDIRGVGSGAAAIEYVERGAYLERNVLLHEYVHLFHSRVLTDEENRKIRALYYTAMKEKRTLDYYSQNNESEYFAQTYPAYFEPVKVHPLDFKSMNTTADLKQKDPGMYAFIDQLVKKERAYLSGDKQAMAENWAQIYVNLSSRTRRNPQASAALLDTALQYDARCLPAHLAYARLEMERKDFAAAASWLKKAETINPDYAPVYTAYADLSNASAANRPVDESTWKEQAAFLRKALNIENDYQERAGISEQLRELYRLNGQVTEAIAVADEYIKTAPVISTYLRDQKEDAVAYAASLRASLGYPEPVLLLKTLVEQRPQNYDFRSRYADALAMHKQYAEAIGTLQEAQRILKAAGNSRSGFAIQIAEYYQALGAKDSVAKYLPPALDNRFTADEDRLRYTRLLIATGKKAQATELLSRMSTTGSNAYTADYLFTKGKLEAEEGHADKALKNYEKALQLNPYHLEAYTTLLDQYTRLKQEDKIQELKKNRFFYKKE